MFVNRVLALTTSSGYEIAKTEEILKSTFFSSLLEVQTIASVPEIAHRPELMLEGDRQEQQD